MNYIVKEKLVRFTKSATNLHRPDGSPNVFVFARPRGGSTWLTELILSQPTFKAIDEPLNLRHKRIRDELGLHTWESFYGEGATAALESYFGRICDGTLHVKDTNFFYNKHYRYLTRRIVFKMIHGGEDRINWFRDTFNGRIVFLLRHPMAVSVSYEEICRLESFVNSSHREHFTDQQLAFAEKVIRSGSFIERCVLSWCFEMAVPLRQITDDWVVTSYEQLVLEPAPVLKELARKLELPDTDLMNKQLHVASNSTYKSDETTRQMLGNTKARDHLVKKWRKKTTPEETRRAMAILEVFELDTYTADGELPHKRYWIKADTQH